MLSFGDSFRIPGKTRWVQILIWLNILSFSATHMFQMPVPPDMLPGSTEIFMLAGGVIPAEFGAPEEMQKDALRFGSENISLAALRPPFYVTLFWSLFLHANLLHLVVNLFFLYHLGRNVEAYMGGLRFVFFYLSCGSAGMLAQVLYDTGSTAPIVGASGAISGLMGAYLILFSDHDFRLTFGQFHRNYRDVIFPFKVILVVWALNQVLMLLPDPHHTQSVAVFAHIGGFACGLLLAKGRSGGRRRNIRVVPGEGRQTGPFWGVD